MNVAVILAGGIGARVGAKVPKQFVEVLGKPILSYTIETFQNHPQIDAIEVVCHTMWKEYLGKMIEKYSFDKVKWVADGGRTFQESVRNGIDNLQSYLSREDIVLVHFGASPFLKEDIIADCIRVCNEKGNAISASDYYLLSGKKKYTSSVNASDNFSDIYIDRDTIACMNSPHAFKFGFIKDIYDEAYTTGIINEVEPHTTSLMYKMNKRIYFAKGSQANIKITTREDIDLFEGYLMRRNVYEAKELSADVVVFVLDGFEICEVLKITDLLRKEGVNAATVSVSGKRIVYSSSNIPIVTDALVEAVDYSNVRMIVLLGEGLEYTNMEKNEYILRKCIEFAESKTIAAMNVSPCILARLGLLNGKRVNCDHNQVSEMNGAIHAGSGVVWDGNIITAQGSEEIIPFVLEIKKCLGLKNEVRR